MNTHTINCRAALVLILLTSALPLSETARADQAAIRLPSVSAGHYDYPMDARRLGRQGRFLVELVINSDGQVTDVGLLSADPQGVFDHSLAVNLRKLRFHVPRDWESSGGSKRRFRINFLFLVRPCPEAGPCAELSPLTSDPVITFTGAPISR